MRDFQVRDTSVNNLGNSKGMSRSQGLWMSQAYGRNWKNFQARAECVSSWCEVEYHYQDASFKLNLAALQGSSVEEVLKNWEFLSKIQFCPVSWLNNRVEIDWVSARGTKLSSLLQGCYFHLWTESSNWERGADPWAALPLSLSLTAQVCAVLRAEQQLSLTPQIPAHSRGIPREQHLSI